MQTNTAFLTLHNPVYFWQNMLSGPERSSWRHENETSERKGCRRTWSFTENRAKQVKPQKHTKTGEGQFKAMFRNECQHASYRILHRSECLTPNTKNNIKLINCSCLKHLLLNSAYYVFTCPQYKAFSIRWYHFRDNIGYIAVLNQILCINISFHQSN